MSPVPVGVIGLGFMGSLWARALAEHPGADLRIVSDVDTKVGQKAAASFSCRFVPDPLEAAAEKSIVGVAVCTPEHLHLEPALAALDAGKVLAVEKPIAHLVEAAELIRDRARERSLPVLVGHVLRFEPRYAALKRAIDAGEIGSVQAVRHERIGLVSDQHVLKGRTSIPLYYGVHEFDLARWYAGGVKRIYAERSSGVLRAAGYEIEDLYSAVLHFNSGAHGTAMLGWSLPKATPGFGLGGVTVIGERGMLRIAQGDTGLLSVGESGLRDIDVYYAPDVHGRLRGALSIEIDHFVDCMRGAADPVCTASDGLEAVRISLAMEASAATKRPIELTNAVR
jgi:predicted dehydrogenase